MRVLLVFALLALLCCSAHSKIFVQQPADAGTAYYDQILGYLTKLLDGEGTVALSGNLITVTDTIPNAYTEAGKTFQEIIYTPGETAAKSGAKMIKRVAAHALPAIIRPQNPSTDARKQLSAGSATPETTVVYFKALSLGEVPEGGVSIHIGIPTPSQWEASKLLTYNFLLQDSASGKLQIGSFKDTEYMMLGHELVHTDRLFMGEPSQNRGMDTEANFKWTLNVPKADHVKPTGKADIALEERTNWMEIANVGFFLLNGFKTFEAPNVPGNKFAKDLFTTTGEKKYKENELVFENSLRLDLKLPLRCRYAPYSSLTDTDMLRKKLQNTFLPKSQQSQKVKILF